MCGYCTEHALLTHWLRKPPWGERLGDLELSLLLQEARDWLPLIDCRRVPVPSVVLCRLLDARLDAEPPEGEPQPWKLSRVRRAVHDACHGSTSDFADPAVPAAVLALSDHLHDPQTVTGDLGWRDFVAARTLRTAESAAALEHYVSWWLQGNGLRRRDPATQIEETGAFDPLGEAEPEERRRFTFLFPTFFFAAVYLARQGSREDLLERVAVADPFYLPDLDGMDLWLQRRAFLALLRPRALPLTAFVGKVRNGLLYHAANALHVPISERKALAAAVREAGCCDDYGYWQALAAP